ncbi:Protein of unknown function (DUF616) [Abeliophyllum distichum]|uniref:TOD1/MUCI70 glycosyltransferase-like domain-containing protein n=1 Tax=Abeliophyllum distichum TaxID=126358 RepID=A0ABD1VYG0_9LAMI
MCSSWTRTRARVSPSYIYNTTTDKSQELVFIYLLAQGNRNLIKHSQNPLSSVLDRGSPDLFLLCGSPLEAGQLDSCGIEDRTSSQSDNQISRYSSSISNLISNTELTPRLDLRSVSSRAARRNQQQQAKYIISGGKLSQDYTMRIIWKRGFIRLVLTAGIIWMLLILTVLLFHVWSCQSSVAFFSVLCNKDSKVFGILNTMGLMKPLHRCSIPVADDPNEVVIPKRKSPEEVVQHLSYIMEDNIKSNGSQSPPLFGGHQTWQQRDESFKVKPTMKVHCGFMRGGGAEMAAADINYVKKCRFVVASGIFDGYDTPHQPSNISKRSQRLFCFLMVVDEVSLDFNKNNVTVTEDNDGGQWVGIWRLILLKHQPYDEPRRNGKVPKILTHRLFPQAQYSIWIDGKMELIVDPLLILERYLWRGKHTFAIAQHKHHLSIYEEADANKRRKRYARPLIDLHMKIYRYEGNGVMESK